MSVAEDTELRDLVSQILEKNGILAKIRAELRASVFLALEDQPQENKSHFINNALEEYLTKAESALGLCLVREFLEHLQLYNTLAVFNTETHHGKDYEYKGRSMLIEDLHLEKFKEKRGPLLSTIIQIAQDSLGSVSTAALRTEEQQGEDFETNNTSSPKPNMPSNISFTDTSSTSLDHSHKPLNTTFTTGTVLITSFGSPEASLDKKPMEAENLTSKLTSEAANIKQDFTSEEPNGNVNPTRGFSDSRQGFETGDNKNSPTKDKFVHSTFTNPQTSLSNLPPLTEMKAGKNHASVQKSLISALTGADDQYEDDFSSGSSGAGDQNSRGKSERLQEKKDIDSSFGKTSPKDLNSPAASVSEELRDPPLTEMKAGKNRGSVQKSWSSALTGGDDQYEDDFSSESSGAGDRNSRGKSGRLQEKKDIDSAFGKTSPKDLNSPAASVSEELEEDGNSVTDDVNSAASPDTLDSSLSNLDTKIADHMEGY